MLLFPSRKIHFVFYRERFLSTRHRTTSPHGPHHPGLLTLDISMNYLLHTQPTEKPRTPPVTYLCQVDNPASFIVFHVCLRRHFKAWILCSSDVISHAPASDVTAFHWMPYRRRGSPLAYIKCKHNPRDRKCSVPIKIRDVSKKMYQISDTCQTVTWHLPSNILNPTSTYWKSLKHSCTSAHYASGRCRWAAVWCFHVWRRSEGEIWQLVCR